jgi:hypothetical protein
MKKIIIMGSGQELVVAQAMIEKHKIECEIMQIENTSPFAGEIPYKSPPKIPEIFLKTPPDKRELYGNHKRLYKYHK